MRYATMKRLAWILFITLILCAWDVRPQAASATTPTIDQWLSLKTILKREASPRISPDGRFVAYSIRTPVWETNSFDDQIWIANVSSGESYQLTEAKGSSSNIKWSPDGKRIGFIFFTPGGGSQIYLASPPSREVVRLTQVNSGVDDFTWSPDAHRIAFTTGEAR
ncbi:MAG: PD40 domain-containing protein, partial [Microcoleus sp. C1-bin4]|nr:PD40 domain-containing protein [Microcoleus sp. C1-bin4]